MTFLTREILELVSLVIDLTLYGGGFWLTLEFHWHIFRLSEMLRKLPDVDPADIPEGERVHTGLFSHVDGTGENYP